MNKKLLLSMLLVFLTALFSFGKTGDDPINLDTFEIVVLPADTSMGDSNVVEAEKGRDLDINWISRPKHGYEVDHWVSKKGLTLYNISDDDTIIVYFKKMLMYTITVISNDTTRGTVTGSGDYIDGEKVYLEHYAKEGSQFDYWFSTIDSTRFGNRIWAYRNDTIVGKFIDASATPEVGDKPCQVVVLSADTTQGTVGKDSLIQEIGTFLYIDVYPKYGYVFDHWYSVKGLPTNRVSGNDTIIAYFKELPKHNIVFVSNDTLKGYAHGGNGLYPEGKIMQTETSFYLQEQPLLYGSFPGYHFAYWETNMGNLKTLSDYYVTANDTITLHFENDTIPEGYLNIYLSHIDSLSLYGNIAISNRHNTDSDSIIVTNKSTGKTDTLPIALQHKYNMKFGDTLLLSIKTSDGYVSDSIYTIVYDDSSSSSLDKEISLQLPMKKIELEEAEGDSFDVHIVTYVEDYSYVIEWEGNGRYAKGDTIEIKEHGYFYKVDNDIKEYYFYKANDSGILSFVVNNNIDLTFWVDAPVGVDQVVAEKESDPFVNVYTINGYLLKHHVNESEALDGLNRGLYIVGRKKVFVNK